MDRAEYDKLDRLEDSMWWFAATHANLLTLARQFADPAGGSHILDAGCGTGGLLATFSCSGGIDIPLFQKIVAGAAIDAQANAAIVARLTASADHPVALNFPEGEYLKGLLVRKRG